MKADGGQISNKAKRVNKQTVGIFLKRSRANTRVLGASRSQFECDMQCFTLETMRRVLQNEADGRRRRRCRQDARIRKSQCFGN